MPEKNVKPVKVDPVIRKRVQYLEMASIVNTLLERRYFSEVIKALEKDSQDDFEKICEKANVPNGARNQFWEILKKTWKASSDETPWLTTGI
jgi:hypothetical protein